MTPYIFPGLKKPDPKLYFDLQAMIAENGGRIRLAEKLECEMVKSRIWFDSREYNIPPHGAVRWSEDENNLFILGKSNVEIHQITGRTLKAVVERRRKSAKYNHKK
jgi:hypothetical protein